MNALDIYKSDIDILCKTHKVKSLYAFGSVLTEKFSKESDIDLIVDFTNIGVEDYADNYFDFKSIFKIYLIICLCFFLATASLSFFDVIRLLCL